MALTAGPARADHGTPQVVSTGLAGGNGALDAGGGRLSSDGSRTFFTTRESLVVADTDSSVDVYERTGSTTTLVSTGTTGGTGAFDVTFRRASTDGSVVAFSTAEQLVASDTDAKADIYTRSGGTTELASSGPTATGQFEPFFEDMSPDGAHIAFSTSEPLTADDTDASPDVYEHFGGATTLVSIGPVGTVGSASIARFAAGGQRIFFGSNSELVSGDTDGAEDIYERTGGVTTLATPGINQCHLVGFTYCEGVYLDDVSDDGDRIIFESGAYLAGDSDVCSFDDNEDPIGCMDLFERSGGTYRLVTTGTTSGGDDFGHNFEVASEDASYVLFITYENLQPTDDDGVALDAYVWHAGTTTHLSAKQGGGSGAFDVGSARLSTDGLRAFFVTREALLPADTDTSTDVYQHTDGLGLKLVSTAPGAGNGAADATLRAISADGSRVFFETSEPLTAADTDLRRDAYERILASSTHLISPGSGAFDVTLDDVSETGRRAVFETGESLLPADTDTSVDVYSVTAPTGYPRPKGATPLSVPLVPAFQPCAAANRTHGPPLSFGSCNPPAQASPRLTVGTPDANGNPARSAGQAALYTVVGNPMTLQDEADIAIGVDMTDVRNASDLSDYTGELELRLSLQLTDKGFGEAQTVPLTMLGFAVPCTATADASGAHCHVTTSADAAFGSFVQEKARAVWGLGQIQVKDGGPDGVASTQDNDVFAVQGVFIP